MRSPWQRTLLPAPKSAPLSSRRAVGRAVRTVRSEMRGARCRLAARVATFRQWPELKRFTAGALASRRLARRASRRRVTASVSLAGREAEALRI